MALDVKPLIRYPGAKWSKARWITRHLPAFKTYVEPYFGSGAIFLSLPNVPEYSVLNDKSKQVVNLFRVLRERSTELIALVELTPWARDEYYESYQTTGDELEDARRFLVRCWQAHGTKLGGRSGWRNRGTGANGARTYTLWNQLPERILSVVERLKLAEIENREALDVISRFAEQPDCLLYVDPPYVLSTRSGNLYEHEMTDQDHTLLLDALDRHAGPVVLSGYDNPLYQQRLSHWQCVQAQALAEEGKLRTEVLWLNAKAQRQQLSLFE